jgi:hypothetical protein
MLCLIFSHLIGRLPMSGLDAGMMAVPTAANEAVPISLLRVNPTPFLRFGFVIAPCQPFVSVPIATWAYSSARLNLFTFLAIVIPDSFRAHTHRATGISVWRERTLQSSISCLSFSAPAHSLNKVRILTVASRSGRSLHMKRLMRSIPCIQVKRGKPGATLPRTIVQRMLICFGRKCISRDKSKMTECRTC